ncbi:MAG: hypothetical protein HRU23_02185 [Gammaproteobacteria bacterium]|nr:hypothetical protein [Gammaproteobacteria bacterium]
MPRLSYLSMLLMGTLVGCGSSDTEVGNNVEITAFDGYLKNALVFHDVNKDGSFNVNDDTIFGLTNEQGKILIGKPTEGFISVATITQNGPLSDALTLYDSTLYSGIYTVDQDFPNQSVAADVVYSAPVSSSVISPITDLVVLEMANGSKTEIEAIAAVKVSLNDDSLELYRDFVAQSLTNDSDARLHKTAQILAASKAKNLTQYKNKPMQMAKEAADLVTAIVNDTALDIRDNDVVAIVDGDDTTVSVINNKLKIDPSIYAMIVKSLPQNLTSDAAGMIVIPTNQLFTDKDNDQHNIVTRLTSETLKQLTEFGFTADISDAESLFNSNEILKSGVLTIAVEGVDVDANDSEVGQVVATFTLEINNAVINQKPLVNSAKLAEIQAQANEWKIQAGVDFNFTIDLSELFTDPEGDSLSVTSRVLYSDGVKVVIDDYIAYFGGSAHNTYNDKTGRLYFSAIDDKHGDDNDAWVDAWIDLPIIEAGVSVEPSTNVLVGPTLFISDVEFIASFYGPTEALAQCHSWQFIDGQAFYGDYSDANTARCYPGDAERTYLGTYVEDGDDVVVVTLDDGGSMTFSHLKTLSESFSNEDKLLVKIDSSKVNDQIRTVEMYTAHEDIKGLDLYSDAPCSNDVEQCFGNISQHVTRVITASGSNEQVSEPLNIKVGYSISQLTAQSGYHVELNLFDYPADYAVTCEDITAVYGGQRFVRIKSEFNQGALAPPHMSNNCQVDNNGVILAFDIGATVILDDVVGITLVPSNLYADKIPKISLNMTYVGD